MVDCTVTTGMARDYSHLSHTRNVLQFLDAMLPPGWETPEGEAYRVSTKRNANGRGVIVKANHKFMSHPERLKA